MGLISFVLAWVVFLVVLNICQSFLPSVFAAAIAFISFLLMFKFELWVPFLITFGILVVAIIVVLILINTR